MNLDTIKEQLEKLTFDELMKVNNMLEDAINDEHQLRCNQRLKQFNKMLKKRG